ncbi:Long-chain fatty acid transport-like protein, partial [Leptotrombidium deliense]
LHSLVHCISCLHSKAIVFDAEYEKVHNFSCVHDTLFYVYTSGTTGFPKAVISKHYRMCMSLSLHHPLNLTENDIIYNPFPLYHNLGNFLGVGSALISGRTVVLRKKFSASAFWDDCIKYKCTVAPYIGEAAAYLLKQPPKMTDRLHNVEKMYGLGMRSTIWSTFCQRFGVKQIVELFGSSEGNTNLVNIDNHEGACGFIPVWIPMFVRRLLFPISFVKIDATTSEIIRDSNGFCIACDCGDTGMIVAKIDNNDPLKSFDGYLNKEETEKKIIRNVFRNGDSYFLSGDVLHMDEYGYIYFKDRVGDTFRWKGENVSTNEVEGLISKILNVTECVVYGVQIPNAVGKAGMVAIATSETIDFKSLYKSMCEILPKYAIPIFIRIMKHVELTSTFKFSKVTLKNEAYDVSLVHDPIYVLEPKSQMYVKLNFELYEDILNAHCFFCRVWNYLHLFVETIRRDLTYLLTTLYLRVILYKDYLLKVNVCKLFECVLKNYPKKVAFVSEESKYTFKDVDEHSNKVANYFSAEGLKAGDEIALIMNSTPEQIIFLLGCAKIGVVPAIIDGKQDVDTVVHSISAVDVKAIVFDPEFKAAIIDAYAKLPKEKKITYHCFGEVSGYEFAVTDFKAKLDEQNPSSLSVKHEAKYSDRLCYLYTSGTTGYPKAAIIRHSRFIYAIRTRNVFLGVQRNDIIYDAMPTKHHILGLVLAAGSALVSGQSVVLKKTFTPSEFWSDCLRYQCTVRKIACYIGEMVSHLLSQAPDDVDKEHRVRKMYGIGMRGVSEKQFRERFLIERIYEFYGSTEGNATLVNMDNKAGACGFIPIIIPDIIRKYLYPISLVKVNTETGVVTRNESGCIPCEPGQTGTLLGRIERFNPMTAFAGYVNKEETDKKILRDVFAKGDRYFMTDDIFAMDELGYLYFRDRVGDAFKWKGEDIFTYQMEELTKKSFDDVRCVAYGVTIPKTEGKAPMVAIEHNDAFDANTLYAKLFKVVPNYSTPIFVRLLEKIEMTSTARCKKVELRKEGFDVNIVKDPIYVLNSKTHAYDLLTPDIYRDIMSNRIQF